MTELMNWLMLQLETNPGKTWAGLLGILALSIYGLWLVILLDSNGHHYSVNDPNWSINETPKPNRNEEQS